MIVLVGLLAYSEKMGVNGLAFFGVVMMLAGMVAVYRTRNKPRKLVVRALFTAAIIQLLSFLFFSGFVHGGIVVTWLLAGLAGGALAGLSTKLEPSGNSFVYGQKPTFALTYMSLLLLNQLIVLLFKVYFPIMLTIAAVAAGMQAGHSLVLLAKFRRMKAMRIGAAMLFFCAALLLGVSGMMSVAQAEDLSGSYFLKKSSIDSAQVPDKCWKAQEASTGFSKAEILKKINDYWPSQNYILKYENGKYILRVGRDYTWSDFYETIVTENQVKAQFHKPGALTYNYYVDAKISGREMVGTVEINGYAVYTDDNGKRQSYPIIFQFTAVRDQPGTAGSVTPEAKGGSPFVPQPVSDKVASTAVAISGMLAGLSALAGSTSAFGSGVAAVVSSIPTPVDSAVPGVEVPQATPTPSTPLVPLESQSQPPYGTRREDGKVYTRNHGWQNEDYPAMNVNSIKTVIDRLENDLQKYNQSGDQLRTEITVDALKRKKRELRAWQEDDAIAKRAKLYREEDLNKSETETWLEIAEKYRKAENIASTVSFTADIALAVGTSGASTTLSGASKTLKALAAAKDVLGTGAEVLKDYRGEKSLSQIAAEQISKRVAAKAVSLEFDKAKIANRIPRRSTSKALKGLWDAAETSAGSLTQKAFDDTGITENFGKGVDRALGGGKKQ